MRRILKCLDINVYTYNYIILLCDYKVPFRIYYYNYITKLIFIYNIKISLYYCFLYNYSNICETTYEL